MLEARVERHLVREVRKHGGEVRKVAWLGRRHAPDRLVLWFHTLAGMHDLIELKRPGERARKGQEREHARLRRAGFRVYVLDTTEKVDEYIAERA